nr:MAG TPA: hypothetical protein [Caudoviricetes sp.]
MYRKFYNTYFYATLGCYIYSATNILLKLF